ncbi:10696_t:CDS:2 [Diversispora eburnea]|uniref:10696_t:CDS:1 n=1 Tax=Diversispora eburnea TaxID=1213867 RepID=A0A9N9GKF3_9GLOM|nr:10696_t:CDS:2 [Diversispora eburnea]
MRNKFVTDLNKLEDGLIYAKLVYDKIWRESEENIANSTIILSIIWALLKNLPISDSFFISTLEKQSIASANKKGDGFMRRYPDIMFVTKYWETIFELMFLLNLYCSKKINDNVKLWREYNDELFWMH